MECPQVSACGLYLYPFLTGLRFFPNRTGGFKTRP